MRITNKISILAFSALTLALTSCLKDKDYDNRKIQAIHADGNTPKFVEIGLTSSDNTNVLGISLDLLTHDTTFNLIPVVLTGNEVAQQDVHVTLVKDDALVTDYNTENGTDLQIPAAGQYTILNPGGVVTIPKGSRVGYLQVKLTPSNFLGATYALGYRISAIDNPAYTISGNLSTGILAFGIKNAYEGNYRSTGYFSHPTSPRAIARNKYLYTVDANTIEMELGDLGSATTVDIYIDPTTHATTATGGPGAPAGVGNISGDATYNNTYDPATHTFRLKYGYPQPSPTRIVTELVVRQ